MMCYATQSLDQESCPKLVKTCLEPPRIWSVSLPKQYTHLWSKKKSLSKKLRIWRGHIKTGCLKISHPEKPAWNMHRRPCGLWREHERRLLHRDALPTQSESRTARAVSVTTWITIRTRRSHLCHAGISEMHFVPAVARAAPFSSSAHTGAPTLWQGHNRRRWLKFCWAAEILVWGISHYSSAFLFHIQSSAYLCPDPCFSPRSYHIPSLFSTKTSVFKLIPSHSALHGEHFIVTGQYLGPLILQRGCFFLLQKLPSVIETKRSILCKVQCSVLVLTAQTKIQHIFTGTVWWLTFLELARDFHNSHLCFAAPEAVVMMPICLNICNWHTGQANISFFFFFPRMGPSSFPLHSPSPKRGKGKCHGFLHCKGCIPIK